MRAHGVVADLCALQLEQAGCKEFFFDGVAQGVFDQAVVRLRAGQEQHIKALGLPGAQLACAQRWGLDKVARQAVSERGVQGLGGGGGVKHHAIGAAVAQGATGALVLAGDADGTAQGSAKCAAQCAARKVGPGHGLGGLQVGCDAGDAVHGVAMFGFF